MSNTTDSQQPSYYQWTEDGSLHLDVLVHTLAGPEVQRTVIPAERLATIIGDSPEGARFFLKRVMGGLQKKVDLPTDLLKRTQKLGQQIRSPSSMFNRPAKADEILGPQLVGLEKLLGVGQGEKKTATLRAYALPVGQQR